MDLVKAKLGSYSETSATSTVEGNEVTGTEAERVTHIKEEEDQETSTVPVIKTEPEVTAVLW
jgi:hypothetical protein